MNPLSINGAHGEGGGQIVRSSMALALVTSRPITIENIRAGRKNPGLRQQHLAAVRAAATVCGGQLQGAQIGSQWLAFEPQPVRAGNYRFDVSTAGSATLVLQTVLPALLTAGGRSQLVLTGGTHNPWAPPFDFLQRAFLPLVCRTGARVTATLERHGFYPAGGGQCTVTIEPAGQLSGFDLLERGKLRSSSVCAIIANLPSHIAEREIKTVLGEMNWKRECGQVREVEAAGPGNVVYVEIACEHVTELFTAFGRRGVRAERVAQEAAEQATEYLESNAAVGPYLADQLILPLGISAWQPPSAGRRRGGSFRTLPLSQHTTTHIEILRQFLEIDIQTIEAEDGTYEIRVGPAVAE